jgi:hypothetical protein
MPRLRRTFRHALNLATALSFLLALATLVLWERSGTHHTLIRTHVKPDRYASLSSNKGRMQFQYVQTIYPYDRRPFSFREQPTDDTDRFTWCAFHAGKFSFPYEVPQEFYFLIFPHWLLAALALALPVVRLLRRQRRHPIGNCPACGYDLRATPHRCPECGHTPEGFDRDSSSSTDPA